MYIIPAVLAENDGSWLLYNLPVIIIVMKRAVQRITTSRLKSSAKSVMEYSPSSKLAPNMAITIPTIDSNRLTPVSE